MMYDQQKRPIRKTQRPWLELEVDDVPSDIARTKGRSLEGVLVTGLPSKAALDAGLKTGDIILAINDKVVYNQKELFSYIDSESKPHDVVMLRVMRDDEGMDVQIKLGSRTTESEIHEQLQESISVTTLNCPYCGADVNNLAKTCPQCRKELWFPKQIEDATYPTKNKKKPISPRGLFSEKPIAYKIKRAVITLNGKIHTSPDTTSSTISKVQEGDKVIILEDSGEFYKVRLESNNEVTGYVEKDLFASKRATVSLKGPMFAEPDIASSPVCEVFEGDKLIILDEGEKFYHVKLESDRSISGYIGKELIITREVKSKRITNIPESFSETKNIRPHYTNKISTDVSPISSQEVVHRPGLLSFIGYFYAVIGWIGVIGGGIALGIGFVSGVSKTDLTVLSGPLFFGGLLVFAGGCFLAGTGHGVLNGGGVARFFATLWSILLAPTIILTILFLIGLYNSDASDYFKYRRNNRRVKQ